LSFSSTFPLPFERHVLQWGRAVFALPLGFGFCLSKALNNKEITFSCLDF